MLVAGIKSRPVYSGLNIDNHAKRHLFALEGEGALALIDQVKAAGSDFLKNADILYVASGSRAEDHDRKLAALGADTFWLAPTIPVLLNRFHVMLGQAQQVAMNHGVDPASIHAEHRGSAARRVQCVHCKGITDSVTTSPYTCTHCGLSLLVRDHYSRRLGAFQGVCIDAEEPGTAPKPEELFP